MAVQNGEEWEFLSDGGEKEGKVMEMPSSYQGDRCMADFLVSLNFVVIHRVIEMGRFKK